MCKKVSMLVLISIPLAACGGRQDIAFGAGAFPEPTIHSPSALNEEAYRYGIADELSIRVFQEPDLSTDRAVVDPSGMVAVPGLGLIQAQGRTSDEIGSEVAGRLNSFLLRDAQVVVGLVKPASRTITVNGAVQSAGVFPMPGRMSLIQAIAMGEGITDTASRSNIIVFRESEGQRFAARFDLGAIQAGNTEDPVLQPGDIVIVGTSTALRIYRDLLQILPATAGVFVALAQR